MYNVQRTSIAFNQLLLLVVSIAWGFAFVAQRSAMNNLGPFTFNAVRFLCGGILLFLFIKSACPWQAIRASLKAALPLAGCLFAGASLQQSALQYADAGRAGFITALYLLFVPCILFLVFRERTTARLLYAIGLAVIGMFLLSDPELALDRLLGDCLLLLGAVAFAAHVVVVGHLVKGQNPLLLAALQFILVGLGSSVVAVCVETPAFDQMIAAWLPLLYATFISIGVGYTLQVVAQEHVPAVPATLIMSLEAVFAALGGTVLLGERMGAREITGCTFIFCASLLACITPRLLIRYVRRNSSALLSD